VTRSLVQVFLSSTARDLLEYRKAIHAELNSTGYFYCLGQENFGPQNAGALEFCRKTVGEATIFVGLIGWRRGWEPDGNVSITEMEHDWAKQAGLRRYIYVAPSGFKIADELRETDAQYDRQQAFRNRMMAGGERIVSQDGFETADRLASMQEGRV